jgi:hypothetical protein
LPWAYSTPIPTSPAQARYPGSSGDAIRSDHPEHPHTLKNLSQRPMCH